MLKKYFLSNILITVLLNVLVKPVWIFVIDRNVQLTVGHEAYGLYGALLSLTIIFNILLDLGITNFNNKNIASDQSQMMYALPNMIMAKGILSLLYLIVIFIMAYVFGYTGQALRLLIWLGVLQLLNSFLQYLRSNISAHHDFKLDALLSVLDKIIMILICSVLLFSNNYKSLFKIEWFVYSQIIAYLLAITAAMVITIRRYTKIHFHLFSAKEIMKLGKQSLPYALLILLMSIHMRSDTLILERLKGATENSYYSAAYRILDAVNMLGVLFAGILLPMFSRMINNGTSLNNILKTSIHILLPISLGIVAFSIAYKQNIMQLLYHDGSQHLQQTYMYIIASFPAYCLMYVFSTLLTANGNIVLLIKIACVGCIVSIGLNFCLVPIYGSEASAWVSCLVQWLLALLYMYQSIQKMNLQIQVKWIAQFALFFVLLLSTNIGMIYLSIPILMAVMSNMILFIILVYGIKLWDKKTIMDFVKR